MRGNDAVAGLGRLTLVGAALAVFGTGCAKPRVAEVYPQVAEYNGREIAEVSFSDPAPFSADSLADLTETEATDCSLLGLLPVCFWGGRTVRRLEMRTVGEDLSRLAALYRQTGYFGTRVVPEIEEVDEDGGPVRVRFDVQRGDGIVLDSLVVEGTEGIAAPDSLEEELPLQAGELLDLRELLASADTVVEALRIRGHAYAEVLRNYAVDTLQDRATVWLLAVPGPRVVVDSIVMRGIDELERPDIMRHLSFRSGDLLRLSGLRQSQRNLYDLELVQFASVAVAPDSLQRTREDSSTATVRVVITEAPEHVVETQVSYGSVECFGVQGSWTDRSVFGRGRKLTLRGSVSRIGVGDPLSGLEGICPQGEDQDIATTLDYRAAAEFTQPYFLSPRNELAFTLFGERQSEPNLYQRTAYGGRASLIHQTSPRQYMTGAVDAEFRQMVAIPLLYCAQLRVCDQGDVQPFEDGRWRNAISGSWVRNRGRPAVNPTSGYVLQTSGMWSTGLIASDYDFLRANVEAATYRSVGNGVVLALGARVGSFLTRASIGADNFVPPEERFYGGGASSVRGFGRFRLGPGLYLVDNGAIPPAEIDPDTVAGSDRDLQFFPTGGVSVTTLSVEGRFPSPVLGELVRLAAFIDAGTVGLDPVWEVSSEWRVTPGVGLRIRTPVGPARVDIGYNPYPPTSGRLFAQDPGSDDLVRIADDFEPSAPGFWDRLSLHIAVGQPF